MQWHVIYRSVYMIDTSSTSCRSTAASSAFRNKLVTPVWRRCCMLHILTHIQFSINSLQRFGWSLLLFSFISEIIWSPSSHLPSFFIQRVGPPLTDRPTDRATERAVCNVCCTICFRTYDFVVVRGILFMSWKIRLVYFRLKMFSMWPTDRPLLSANGC